MRICAIPGDGIGNEVIAAASRVLRALDPAVAIEEHAAGWAAFERYGVALPAPTLQAARAADGILFGAAGSPSDPVTGYRSPIVQLRRELDLFANLRPVAYRLPVDNRREEPAGGQRSLVIVRENTEGLYAGRERLEDDGNTAIAERVITRRASERIARAAFELARERSALERPAEAIAAIQGASVRRPKVTIVHKANVLRVSDGLFREVCLTVGMEYAEIAVEELLVDVAAMRLARSPTGFDVVVTTNLFGDILSDVACIHGGGLGLAASANLGTEHGLFEPVHGSAPDIAGQGIANPLAAIECVAMLLDWRGRRTIAEATLRKQQAQQLRAAIAQTLRDGPATPDLGGEATTEQVTRAIISRL